MHSWLSFLIPLVVAGACSQSTANLNIADTPKVIHSAAAGTAWYNYHPSRDFIKQEDGSLVAIQGAGVDLFLQQYESRLQHKVIVAVIDTGVDVDNPDLAGRIWRNKNEIPSNGIDDDENGYIDDIHGWNYLVDSSGKNITRDTWEVTREFARYSKMELQGELSEEQKEYFESIKKEYESEVAYYTDEVNALQKRIDDTESALSFFGLTPSFPTADVDTLPESESKDILKDQVAYLATWNVSYVDFAGILNNHEIYRNDAKEILAKTCNLNDQARIDAQDDFAPISIDNPISYGNGKVGNKLYSKHGTQVASVIAGLRDNKLGSDGIAANAQIMALRTNGDYGDERDKDMIHAIRYAVDNGARIINFSIGKYRSPYWREVQAAMRYATEHGVFLVLSAGNDSENNDKSVISYPTRYGIEDSTVLDGTVTVGASSHNSAHLLATFSNYGKREVDLFAPGDELLLNGDNGATEINGGTSFSTPVISGLIALLLGVDNELTPSEVKKALLSGVRRFPGYSLQIPGLQGEDNKTSLEELCSSGGVPDLPRAADLLFRGKFKR